MRLFQAVTASVGLFLSVCMPAISFAADCDPNAILRQNVTAYQSNFLVWLSNVENLTKSTSSSNNSNAAISYVGVALSLSDARNISDYISQQKQFTLSEQQSVSVLRSTLSADSVKAYIACIGANRGVSVIVPDAALNEQVFQLTVNWDPKYKPNNNELTINVTNGNIVGDAKAILQPTESKTFTINRDLSKTLFVSAVIDGQSDLISMPATPKFVVKLRERDSPDFELIRDGGHGTSLVKRDACITADRGIGEFSIYVRRDYRGRGAGRAVLAALIEAAAGQGMHKLTSRVFPENAASRALLKELGFEEIGIHRRHGQLDGRWRDCVIVERLLGTGAHE
jgi:GNAT superfamily N-acetyltransferase